MSLVKNKLSKNATLPIRTQLISMGRRKLIPAERVISTDVLPMLFQVALQEAQYIPYYCSPLIRAEPETQKLTDLPMVES